jgi:galactose mutarotase-like enzyme
MRTIENEKLIVRLADKGAEIRSVVEKSTGKELMWQADPTVWPRTAPVLFPFVGRSNNDEYRFGGKVYPMGQHGFARDKDFEYVPGSDNKSCCFELKSSVETLRVFPFDFLLRLSYRLDDSRLLCGYEVINTGSHELFFSMGAHPGFSLQSRNLSDYRIEFEREEEPYRYLLRDGLINGEREKLSMRGNVLHLERALFAKDAIVLKQVRSASVRLVGPGMDMLMTFAGFPYFGIWTKPGCEDFICLEPWCGIADAVGGYAELEQKEGINSLGAGGKFAREFSVEF